MKAPGGPKDPGEFHRGPQKALGAPGYALEDVKGLDGLQRDGCLKYFLSVLG